MVKGLIIPAEGTKPVEVREFSELADYQAAVGGWIEGVYMDPPGLMAYVNENGIAERLEFNSRASSLWWLHVPQARQANGLVGDVVVVGPPDDDGDDLDLPGELLGRFTSSEPFAVLMQVDGVWYRHRNVNRDYWEAILWAVIKLGRVPEIEEVDVAPASEADAYPFRPLPPIGTMY